MFYIHWFFPADEYQNNKSALEKVLPCLVISLETFFYLYNMEIFLRNIGNE